MASTAARVEAHTPIEGTRVSHAAATDLARIAGERGIAPNVLASEILDAGIRDYAQSWDTEVTPEMIADAEAALAKGEFISHEEVGHRMRGWFARANG